MPSAKIVYPWEGKPSYLRPKRGRGSAAASNLHPQHRMAGYTGEMYPVSKCGVVVTGGYVLDPKLQSTVCEDCNA